MSGPGAGRARRDDPELPPLAPADASDDERAAAIVARMIARHGAPSIEDYRRVYRQGGWPWPGDDEIRRNHTVSDDPQMDGPS